MIPLKEQAKIMTLLILGVQVIGDHCDWRLAFFEGAVDTFQLIFVPGVSVKRKPFVNSVVRTYFLSHHLVQQTAIFKVLENFITS